MAFFQNSVLNKHLKGQDAVTVKAAYQKFTAYFHNPSIQQNIRDAKEEQFQEGFLRELFVDILGYTLNPQPNFNLTTELKNEKGAKKCDGAILQDGKALAVIELKGTDTKDLDKINVQAFNYKNNQTGCVYVITSNFEKLRFFIHHSVEHLEFNLFTLTETEFQLLWLCLNADNLLNGVPLKVKEESLIKEEQITKQLYKDYASFRTDLWHNMVKNSSAKDKLLLFKKTQKLLDRYLFIFFAEDSGLLPPNSISRIVSRWELLKQEDAYKPLYEIFKQYFGYIDKGRKGQKAVDDIFAYNGGLFLPDEVLDNIKLDDEILHPHVMKLTNYDFQSEVDVNILGHIFENSLNEIENITAELEGQEIDKSKTKRKKDGVFYTPKYITKYIVDNTVGKLCDEKKAELGIVDEEYAKGRRNRKKEIIKSLDDNLQAYRNWLLNITICDPACGSGAFLNQALEFLMDEHGYIDELESQLLGNAFEFPGVENHILEKNIFGVDINDESVDIAKLSLWLRTAQKGRKLTSLNNNIKCGNSLIDDPKIAGEKAFNWQKEFPSVFAEKEKKAFHITWVVHNSRTSQRMIDYKVKKGGAFWLEDEHEVVVAKTIKEIVEQDDLNAMALNICRDHVHFLLVCEEEELPNIVRKLKGKSSQKLKEHLQIPKEEQFTLWAQKYSTTYIKSEEQLWNTIEYIHNNRVKHELHSNKGLQPLVESDTMQQSYEHAFRTEHKGGFDVVIGNPPYGAALSSIEKNWFKEKFEITQGVFDSYFFFFEKTYSLLKDNGLTGVITPNTFLVIENGNILRKFLYERMRVIALLEVFNVFSDAVVEPIVSIFRKEKNDSYKFVVKLIDRNTKLASDIEFCAEQSFFDNTILFEQDSLIFNYRLKNKEKKLLDSVMKSSVTMGSVLHIKAGVKPYEKGKGKPPQTSEVLKLKPFNKYTKEDDTWKEVIRGTDINRFQTKWTGEYIKYGEWLAAPRSSELFSSPKIFMRRTDDSLMSDFDNSGKIGINSVHCIQLIQNNNDNELKIILAQLNSKLLNWMFRIQNFHMVGKPLAEVKVVFVERLPFKETSSQEKKNIIRLVDEIIEAKKKLYQYSLNFLNLLNSKFEIEKLNTKLQNWHELEFGYFLKELKKAKVQLSLSEEAEWMHYFNEQKQQAQALKSEINRVDGEIDKMVYELYGLSEEEIKIVEGS